MAVRFCSKTRLMILMSCLVSGLLVISGPGLVQGRPAAVQSHILNVHNADIRAFIQDMARLTGRTFIIDSRVTGTVTVNSTEPLNRAQLFEVFVSTLRANGLVAVPAGKDTYRILPEEGVSKLPTTVGATRFTTRVFRLSTIDAATAAETLKPLVSAQGNVTANRRSNTLVVADYIDNLSRLGQLLAELENNTGHRTESVTLRNASAREIAKVTNELLVGAGGDLQSSPLTILAVDSSNSLLLRGSGTAIDRLLPIIRDLDARAESNSGVAVIYLKHANGEKILPVLEHLLGPKPLASGAQPVTASTGTTASTRTQGRAATAENGVDGTASVSTANGSIAYYAGGNALIINANPDMQRTIAGVVRQLDVPRRQVLVEAIVVEVSDDTLKNLGVQFALSGTKAGSTPYLANTSGKAGPNLSGLISAGIASNELGKTSTVGQTAMASALSSLSASRGLVLGGAGQSGDTLFAVILNAVKADTQSNLLSTPSVMTLDNEEAHLLVGQEVPITTGESLGSNNDNAFRTITRQDVGVQLEVRPQINDDGQITLHLRQEVSALAGTVSSSSPELILNKREIETTVLVDDGNIVVLGGLLKESDERGRESVPGLGRVPVLGGLFRSQSRQKVKTNLMVFIRPTIVRDESEARKLTQPALGRMREAFRASGPDSTSSLDEIIAEYMPARPAAVTDQNPPVTPPESKKP